jgi:hypothetical protein
VFTHLKLTPVSTDSKTVIDAGEDLALTVILPPIPSSEAMSSEDLLSTLDIICDVIVKEF